MCAGFLLRHVSSPLNTSGNDRFGSLSLATSLTPHSDIRSAGPRISYRKSSLTGLLAGLGSNAGSSSEPATFKPITTANSDVGIAWNIALG